MVLSVSSLLTIPPRLKNHEDDKKQIKSQRLRSCDTYSVTAAPKLHHFTAKAAEAMEGIGGFSALLALSLNTLKLKKSQREEE